MSSRRLVMVCIAVSIALFLLRLYASTRLGFGDSEALYACYAWHPQPVYLDHPGLIGLIARIIGRGSPPTPLAAHLATSVLATAAPWVAALAARACGASWGGAAGVALAIFVVPEFAVGLFGLTPDLPLFLLWYAAVGLSAIALEANPGSMRELAAALGSGFAVGLACDAKVSGVLLLLGLILTWASPAAKAHRKSIAPYAGLLVAAVVFSPVVIDEVNLHFPMLRHRLIDTQKGAGPSLRNLLVFFGGQLIYVTPPLLFCAYKVARDLYARRSSDAISTLLWSVTVASLPLALLSIVSRAAEPHWAAPMYLALPLHWARRPGIIGAGLAKASAWIGLTAVALAHAWVLLPLGPWLLRSHYVARYDIANDMFAWRAGIPLVRRALIASLAPDEPPVVVVGPHWTVCAQLHAALPGSVLVGCETEIADDFDAWLPRRTWDQAPVVLYVTDDRFGAEPTLPGRRTDAVWHADVIRGGVPVRRIVVRRMVTQANARIE